MAFVRIFRPPNERLGPALEKVLGMRPPAPPPSTGYELHRVIRP